MLGEYLFVIIIFEESKLLICCSVLSIICHRDLESLGMLLGESYNLERKILSLCHLHHPKFVMQLQVVSS